MEEKKTPLEMAEELNDMDKDMTSTEAEFHDKALKDLRKKKTLKPKDEAKLELIYEKYLGEKPEEEEAELGEDGESGDDADL